MDIETILKIYIAEAMPRITKCIFDEQRAQIRREELLRKLLELYKKMPDVETPGHE